jgi:hypothetical protein
MIITMCFRKNINIKFIVTYLPADNKDHELTFICNNFIKHQIDNAIKNKNQIVILDDFNIDVKEIKSHRHIPNKNWKHKKDLIQYLHN